ncbi:hypothetical protein EPD60_11235 [Flaviaesturariibacter flavus]|uniref:Uncharacterized protein n=1 Tax=Flaviaesturariibacter flavus TaxID=2502780 RepID=A0A4R1BC00_9BACT|nr:hypothetical protein [Flaviaesturariibacter flavus]TCJ14550.1 hypothetical protein EPD60_11235 [Flaviaesturariibacter flavus]
MPSERCNLFASTGKADGTSPDTNAKNLALELCGDLTYVMGRRTFAWAMKNGRSSIAEAINFSETELSHGAEETLLNRFALVLKHAEENKRELAAYKVGDAAIEDLKRAIATFEILRGTRDEKQAHRIYSTALIEALGKKVRGVYVVLDAEVEGLIEDQQFIETYFIARRKTDRKATRAGAAGEAGA